MLLLDTFVLKNVLVLKEKCIFGLDWGEWLSKPYFKKSNFELKIFLQSIA